VKRVVVLGGGRVGAVAARDLAGDLAVTVCDASAGALEGLSGHTGIETVRADLSDPAVIERVVAPFDVVVGALPGDMGYRALEAIIRTGKDVVDISFMPEDPRALGAEARHRGVTAIVDCGVAPGISNMLVGRAAARLESLDLVRILVGGIPRIRQWPYEYKAGFSPTDVIEEYTRSARVVEDGQLVIKPALSDVETLDLPVVGTVEAFLSDGLRTLLDTIPGRWMEEKTVRYPGHAALMLVLRETGFFSDDPVVLPDGTLVRPRDVTERLLFPMWQYEEGEEDLTLMRIEIVGSEGGRKILLTYDLSDAYDPETGMTSMARTTAFPCAAVTRMLAAGDLSEPGVHPPEVPAARPGFWEQVAADLARRDVRVTESEEVIHGT
jgi:saccharopine dehydrogenase-like NADP-dependent oxidoreductase